MLMKKILVLFALIIVFFQILDAQNHPKKADKEAVYKTIRTKVLVMEASLQEEEQPAEFKIVKIQVVKDSKAAIKERYETQERRVQVKPAYIKHQIIYPEFKLIEQKIMVSPPKKKRRKYHKEIIQITTVPEYRTFECFPAELKTIEETIQVKAASEGVSAEFQTFTRQLLETKGYCKEKIIPAEIVEMQAWVFKKKRRK